MSCLKIPAEFAMLSDSNLVMLRGRLPEHRVQLSAASDAIDHEVSEGHLRRYTGTKSHTTKGGSMDAGVQRLHEWISTCRPGGMVFFGGAGVSTESGIPDFRSASGLYRERSEWPYPPEVMISRTFFDEHPAQFFDYYCTKMLALDVRPNAAHRSLAELEAAGVCRAVITQNIDGLHQAAGSKNVLELHGSVHRNFCMECGCPYDVCQMLDAREAAADGVPRCACGSVIKPDVVLYKEPLDPAVMEAAVQAVREADLLIVAGTSLAVYPAAGLLQFFQGEHLAIINRDPTPGDAMANLVLHESIGNVLNCEQGT